MELSSTENHMQSMSVEEITFLVNLVKDEIKEKNDISDIATDIAGCPQYLRTYHSATISLTIVHMLMHGVLPLNEIPQSGNWQKPRKLMLQVISEMGYDVDKHIQDAEIDLKERIRLKKARKTRQQATKLMSQYYSSNKSKLNPSIRSHREQLITSIMNGKTPEEAFKEYL